MSVPPKEPIKFSLGEDPMRQIWLAVVLLTAFIIATIDLADARDKSGVLKASDLIGKKVQNIGWEEAWGHQGSGH